MKRCLYSTLFLLTLSGAVGATTVSIEGTRWRINGWITYPGAPAEGLLMNVRMVNRTFEDKKRADFDSDGNTARFIAKIPEYYSYGVRAFTLNLQGGFPGYEGVVNSGFRPNGALRPNYMNRIKKVIVECDKRGMGDDIPDRIRALKKFNKPIVCNEDDKVSDEAAQAMRACVENGCSWGFMHNDLNQYEPFEFNGFEDDPEVYNQFKQVTMK